MPLYLFSQITTNTTVRVEPSDMDLDRFVGLEHIEPENLHIRSWGLVADGTTFTSTFKRGQVLFAKRRAHPRVGFTLAPDASAGVRLPRTEAGL